MKNCLLIFLSVFSGPSALLAYPTPFDFNHKLLRWNLSETEADLLVRIKNETGLNTEELTNIVIRSADLWNEVEESSISMRVSQDETPHITVTFQGSIGDSLFSAGYAEFDKSKDSGDPEHCSVYILAEFGISWYSLSKTSLHELGHCLGLGHSLIPEAIMSYHLYQNDFALDLDDRAAIARLYPLNGEPELPPGCSTGFPTSSRNLPFFWILLGLPLLISGIYQRHRHRSHSKKVVSGLRRDTLYFPLTCFFYKMVSIRALTSQTTRKTGPTFETLTDNFPGELKDNP